jgi:hypothetical protein
MISISSSPSLDKSGSSERVLVLALCPEVVENDSEASLGDFFLF